MRISIFGLGYVGTVSLVCLARDGHDVIGVDVDQNKLRLLEAGKSPIVEEGIVELTQQVASQGLFRVTNSAQDAVQNSDVSLICVGTPSSPNGSQDLSAIMRLTEQLGNALANKSSHHLLVYRSTLIPGTVEERLIPVLETCSGKSEGGEYDVCFQPEFLREGSSIKDYDNPPYTIVGCRQRRPEELLTKLFGHLPCEVHATSIRSAETVKYFCNIFHALKITFANEVGRFCQSLNVDSHEVMELLCQDRQLNISAAYLKPGYAYGGSCLPKDLRAIIHLARQNDIELPMLSGIGESNKIQIDHAFKLILAAGKRKIGLLGLSFKSGTDDLRESPLVTLAEQLIGKGMHLQICDPEVHLAALMGANKRFIEETIPHIGNLLTDDYQEIISSSDVIVIGQNYPEMTKAVRRNAQPNQLVVDLVGIQDPAGLAAKYSGICW